MDNIKKYHDEIFFLILFILIPCFVEEIIFLHSSFNIKRFIIIFAIEILLFLISLFLRKLKIEEIMNKKKKTLEFYFVILGSIIGISFSFAIPWNEIPDEATHINLIYEERNLNIKFKDINNGYNVAPQLVNEVPVKVDKENYFDFSKKIDSGIMFSIPKLTIIRHFAQYIGMLFGELMHLPVIMYLTLCELTALAFYLFICYKSLKKMPFKKNMMMFIMLLPVCCQQMSSFSYDVVLNSFCFLYFASILNLKFTKENITLKDILLLLLMIGVIAICKIPYIILSLLLFLLPLNKLKISFKNKTLNYKDIREHFVKHKIIYLLIFLVSLFAIIYIAYKVLLKISIGRVLIASILDFKGTLNLLYRSIRMFYSFYLETIVGNLGLFNIKTSLFFELFIVWF